MQSLSLAAYLAIKEIWRNRGRFLLFSLVIALITLLVLFIAALGEGLGNFNREYISKVDAQLIVFLEKSDNIVGASRLNQTTLRSVRRVEGVADAGAISTSNTAIILANGKVVKVSMLGVEPGRPGVPSITNGRAFETDTARETIIDSHVLSQTGAQIGDTLTIRSTQGTQDEFFTLKVVGTTEGQYYLFQPTIFVPPSTWERVRPKSEAEINNKTPGINVIAVRVADASQVEAVRTRLIESVQNISAADISTTIKSIPGYSAQQGTVQTQAFFTLFIGVLVIGGFFQIQILQKVPQIGVLKAIGSSNAVVGFAAVLQIIIVTAIGVAIGGMLTFLFSLTFPPNIPLLFNGQASVLAILALLAIGPVGGLVSVVYAVRIEPLKALRLG